MLHFVMVSTLLAVLALAGLGAANSQDPCKCTPGNPCWPSTSVWDALNNTVSGKLIRNLPVAISCYPGPYHNKDECANVYAQWSNSTFQEQSPVGYCYPTDEPCPPVDLSRETPGTCTLGPAPVYTINATEPAELSVGMAFAQKHNIRLVVRNTGHDILGKSEGYGALQIWIRYIRKGIMIQDKYNPSDECCDSDWTGAALTIGGGYVWDDVYGFAFKRDITIVGGGDPTVGCIGGYTQGGGHSPASHNYGLAADQVLEAQVVLADGSIVTASPCQNPDLYFAIRGGGGGSYGVVISMTVKAYLSKPVVAQSLTIMPLHNDTETLLDAVTELWTDYPRLMDASFSGYGTWSINSPQTLFANQTVGYVHAIAAMNMSLSDAKDTFNPLLQKLERYNGTSLLVSVSWFQFPTYATYYRTMSGVHQSVGSPNSALTSRMFSKAALTETKSGLRKMIGIIAGKPEETTINSVELVGGGEVIANKNDKYSGLNPAWRSTYIVNVVGRGWADGTDAYNAQKIKDDITYHKGGAMRSLTPFGGSYMNEADRNDPYWAEDFYGSNYYRLAQIKKRYDPNDLFWCPTCVGSPSWNQRLLHGKDYGPLCRTGQ